MTNDEGFGPVTVITPEGSTTGHLMPDDSIKVDMPPGYLELGITADTFACVAIMSEDDARLYAFDLLADGIDCRVARDPDGKRWHVAIRGGLALSPMAWLITIRGRFEDQVVTCVDKRGQHPIVERDR